MHLPLRTITHGEDELTAYQEHTGKTKYDKDV